MHLPPWWAKMNYDYSLWNEGFRVYVMYVSVLLHPTRLYLYILRRLPRHAPSGLAGLNGKLVAACVCVCV